MSNVKVAFLRGINVGGHKKILKADQLRMLENLGFNDAEVYLHTGNWIFSSSEETSEISIKIKSEISKEYGWEVPVLVFSASEIKQIVKACPFSEETKEKSYFTLLQHVPSKENAALLRSISYPGESFVLTDNCVYFYPEKGAGKAKLNNNIIEKKLQVTATSRNYNTLTKILSKVL